MPKLIDYPRTTYSGSWELSEVVDDTGGKCAIETAARKLNRKVSGSFKAIIGSAVKFGLLSSKRDLLTTTTLFKRIKHAYDKQEELLFHREAFLTPPLFTQLCRKFRSRELPVQMLDVMLIREFNVEEINAPGVAKAFIEGCRMTGLLNEHNIIADIDALAAQTRPRREMANLTPYIDTFRGEQPILASLQPSDGHETQPQQQNDSNANQKNSNESEDNYGTNTTSDITVTPFSRANTAPTTSRNNPDAIANLFGLAPILTNPLTNDGTNPYSEKRETTQTMNYSNLNAPSVTPVVLQNQPSDNRMAPPTSLPLTSSATNGYQIQISGPGVNTSLSITEEMDIELAIAVLEKIRRQLIAKSSTKYKI